ncbi:MAG TPA: HAD-IA family hydrolase [Planosporangium sp.]|jgi:putative hydrolase of the HAD superfamily|nr:HAD-IA family hydrolase [Planosporangium sp.]
MTTQAMRAPRPQADALLIDFDGVLYRRDPAASAAVEERHGLQPGTVNEIGAQWGRLRQALAGESSRAEWLDGIAHALSDRVGGLEPARTLVAEAQSHHGEIVPEVLAFVDEVRAAGRRVGLAANAMDDFDEVVARYGLADHFDVIVNSSVIGVHKPAKEFFVAACLAIGKPPNRCLFVDDDDRDVRAARVAGLSAYRYTGPEDFPYLRAALGL